MTPNERADFLAWLMRLDLGQLREVSSHVNSVMTHKRGAKLRLLGPGSKIVFSVGKGMLDRAAGTVVKMFKTSVEVESAAGERGRVEVDAILGLHTGGLEFAPLESAQPLGFPQVPADLPQVECTCHRSETSLGYTASCPVHGGRPGEDASGTFVLEEERFDPPMDFDPPEDGHFGAR
jgi:hypothetical protein